MANVNLQYKVESMGLAAGAKRSLFPDRYGA
jgi:hypothetical protein